MTYVPLKRCDLVIAEAVSSLVIVPINPQFFEAVDQSHRCTMLSSRDL